METKTKVLAEANRQELQINRKFEAPAALVFKAFTEPELFEKWMGTHVVEFDAQSHGSYRFETRNEDEMIIFSAHGTFHEVRSNQRIVRTFEMENTPFPAQLEFLEFESLSKTICQLNMHILFRSVEYRDQLMQMPFAEGLNGAHNRLQELISEL